MDKMKADFQVQSSEAVSSLPSRFQRSCGISITDFSREIQRRAEYAGVPADILLTLMVKESAGACWAIKDETNGTKSLGLFQINTGSTRYPRCTLAQKDELKKMSIAQMYKGPGCVENPVVNLHEAIRILSAKTQALTRSQAPTGFDEKRLKDRDGKWNRNMWRLAVAAYNGGERWVLKAKQDLETFAQKHGETLDAHNWEDLRIFFMRSHLDRFQNGQRMYFGGRSANRNIGASKMNLAYTETIIPRESVREQKADPTLTDQLAHYLSR
jgi:hypothetical protein